MVVNDLDVFRAGRRPAEAQAELIVHADAVLCAAASQGLEPVTRWRAQEFVGETLAVRDAAGATQMRLEARLPR